ncbi:NAD(P)/FAD-dependent oxidoreductase [Parvicella tangerina]|uniref:tRNA 5-methylaminomethyl-2-thiouridine biosynthesis bifunctional protein MnmC n=1 Tax=Parvicella tangerina TaxID=2829795 RepID=A0A916NTY8_9FLAO|nr:FAD-dependent oxidoreductase [Parvicella tangerina]CAG5086646.1 tRNA 5-methylaminomethyl-2-thiouridine biosynthesis bifunctional protein MnmC [Parvicella tangerina]
MSETPKYLVVGQGLAGSVLLYQLEKNDISFDVVDENHKKSGSMAAGGIMHPMSFRRLKLAWRSLELINEAIPFYEKVSTSLATPVFKTSTFYRPFISIEEQNNWMARMNESPYDEILGVSDEKIAGISSPYGMGIINYSGRLEVQDFLIQTRKKFEKNISSEKFDFTKLKKSNTSWNYNGVDYEGVIFCEGFQFIYNPYFNYLPENLTKGEIIEINTEAIQGKTLSRGCFIVPQKGEDNYLVGSTYAWHTVSTEPTEKARQELKEKVEKVIQAPYTVYDQAAGIRPTISDRKPLIGEHPKHKGLYMFNGMGSKTVMMAPKLADQFINFLNKKEDIFSEANLARFTKKHFHKFESYEADQMSEM